LNVVLILVLSFCLGRDLLKAGQLWRSMVRILEMGLGPEVQPMSRLPTTLSVTLNFEIAHGMFLFVRPVFIDYW